MTPPERPGRLAVVVGTGTDIGKTWVTAHVVGELRAAGRKVSARKPVQSYEAGTEAAATDAAVLAAASGEEPHEVCPPHRWYEVAMAPPMAADVLGRPPFTLADLQRELEWPAGAQIGVLETAGGLRSPLAADGDTEDFVDLLRPELVVLVADAGLGTINAVRLSAGALAIPPLVVLNRFDTSDDLHNRNREWLAGDGLEVLRAPADLSQVAGRVGGQPR